MLRTIIFALILVLFATFIFTFKYLPSTNTTLLVSAASSLQESLEEIKLLFQQSEANITINYNFGSSGALQQQIENGAAVDIFIAAAKQQMDALQQKGLILTNSRRNLLTNHLALIVPASSNLPITSFKQLVNSYVKRVAVGEPRSVPVGQYTKELFENLGIWQQINSKFVFGNNVRNVLASVISGNADAGVVYITDAKISKKVKIVAIAPENLHSEIIYPLAIIKNSKNLQVSDKYLNFLSNNVAINIWTKYGFGINYLEVMPME